MNIYHKSIEPILADDFHVTEEKSRVRIWIEDGGMMCVEASNNEEWKDGSFYLPELADLLIKAMRKGETK